MDVLQQPSLQSQITPVSRPGSARRTRLSTAWNKTLHHFRKHVSIGIICAVAYFDPGNWSVDLQAGSNFGYRPMLFVVLMAGIGAIVLQTLACRLGCVTGIDLASHCRLLLHDNPKHPQLVRRAILYPLYLLSEVAIISTDLAELLGSAIGFCLLIPKLPLWAGVVLTASDVFVFLFLADPSRSNGKPARVFEFTIIILVLAVLVCFIILLIQVKPHWGHVFLGYVPSKELFKADPDAVYSAIGIMGATVMPHALFLGSQLATQDRNLAPTLPADLPQSIQANASTLRPRSAKSFLRDLLRVSRADRTGTMSRDYRTKHDARENSTFAFIDRHLNHIIADVVMSLLAIAVPINSAILVLAATVFFQKGSTIENNGSVGLFEAYDLIESHVGNAAAILYAVSLICAGQTSGITATLAGQIVSEGMIEWTGSPFLRRIITRLVTLIPSVIVAVAVGRSGLNTLLVISQVILSIILPFIAFPLIYLTSSKVVMKVRKPVPSVTDNIDASGLRVKSESTTDEFLDFSSGKVLSVVAYMIWLVVLIANAYAIVMLAKGESTTN